MKPLSYTQISLYLSCPLCYKLQYIDRLKTKEKGYFSFGTSLHGCAEWFYRVKTPPPPSLEALLAFYEEIWLSEGYESPEEAAGYRAYGREILAEFHRIHSAAFRMPVAVEKMFMLDVDGIKIRGFIDRVDKLDSGRLAIVDYKTNKDLFTADYVENDLQLTIYQLAAEQLWRLPVETLTLYHLRSNTPCTTPARGPERLEEARDLIRRVAADIEQGNFPATEHKYCPCDFPGYCPYYRHLAVTSPPEPDEPHPLPDPAALDAAAAVERFAAVQAQVKELQDELEEIRRSIVEYCQAESLYRVFGGGHEITCRLTERTGFPEDDVKQLLEPAGLWQQVVRLDEPRLKALLADPALDAALKEKLEALRHVTSSYYQIRLKQRAGEQEED